MKKLVIIVGAIILMLLISLVPISKFLIRTGFENPDKPWAAKCVLIGASIQMHASQSDAARTAYERALQQFPGAGDTSRIYYRIALCYEKSNQVEQAKAWYGKFLQQWPNHMWAAQARNRLNTLEIE